MTFIEKQTGKRDEDFKRDFIENHKDGKAYYFYIGKMMYEAKVFGRKVIVTTTPSEDVKKIFAQCGYHIEKGEIN